MTYFNKSHFKRVIIFIFVLINTSHWLLQSIHGYHLSLISHLLPERVVRFLHLLFRRNVNIFNTYFFMIRLHLQTTESGASSSCPFNPRSKTWRCSATWRQHSRFSSQHVTWSFVYMLTDLKQKNKRFLFIKIEQSVRSLSRKMTQYHIDVWFTAASYCFL